MRTSIVGASSNQGRPAVKPTAEDAVCSQADICFHIDSIGRESRQKTRDSRSTHGGGILASHGRMSWDIAIGRWLALCLHPVCAWRVRSPATRAVLVTSYFAAGYLAALLALLIS